MTDEIKYHPLDAHLEYMRSLGPHGRNKYRWDMQRSSVRRHWGSAKFEARMCFRSIGWLIKALWKMVTFRKEKVQ